MPISFLQPIMTHLKSPEGYKTNMSAIAGIEVRLAALEEQCCIALVARQQDEILQSVPGLAPLPTDIPVFIVLLKDGEAIACGGLRPINGDKNSVAEMKRVYVVPEARGQTKGVSDFLVQQLEWLALEKGWSAVWLQTGRSMHSANKFYERHGYQLMPNYGDFMGHEDTISYAKSLC